MRRKKFRIVADAEFEADSLFDAYIELSNYFEDLADMGEYAKSIFIKGNVEVREIEKKR